jgi:hypothetical protein
MPKLSLAFAIRRHFHRVTRVDTHPIQEVSPMKELLFSQGVEVGSGESPGMECSPGQPLNESWHFV